jgi:two-component system response regulator RegA
MTIALPRLLIAEDDASFRETLALEFQERDYDVTAIACLNDFDRLLSKRFDLAVVDLKLGTDSGLELIEKLHDASPGITSVVLTGYSSIATAVKAIKLGAANYLTKPVSMDDIEAALLGEMAAEESDDYQAPSLARHEWEYIEYVLARCDGNITRAAKELGIHRQSLQRKLRKYPPHA